MDNERVSGRKAASDRGLVVSSSPRSFSDRGGRVEESEGWSSVGGGGGGARYAFPLAIVPSHSCADRALSATVMRACEP